MNEIFDRLLIRIILTAFVCTLLLAYRAAHLLFYPTVKKQVTGEFSPENNPADTLHLFSRLLGISIIFSSLGFDESAGLVTSLFHFLVWGTLTFSLYLISLFVIESVVLYNFEYKDEILKRKNITYAIVCSSHAIGLAFLTHSVVQQAANSLIILIILWLLAMVIVGFASKYYSLLTQLNLGRLLMQQNLGGALSYAGYTLGAVYLIAECFTQEHYDITMYCVQVILKILLAMIIYPLFRRGIIYAFKTKVELSSLDKGDCNGSWGVGIYEACLFLSASALTSLIVNQIQFGTIYPFF